MAIPKAEDFAELFKEKYRAREPSPLLAGCWDGVFGPHEELSHAYVLQVVTECRAENERQLAETSKMAALEWLDKNSTSSRAWSALWGSRNKREYSVQDHAERILASVNEARTPEYYSGNAWRNLTPEALAERMAHDNGTTGRINRLRRALSRVAQFDPLSSARVVALAFHGYFYGDSYRKYYGRADERKGEARELMAAIKRIEDPERWRRCGLEIPSLRISRTALLDLEDVVANKVNPAIKKMDETAPERALAFELWSHFQRTYRANKTTAIYNFLQFEGVKNPPDPRGVERWIKDWKDRGVRLAPTPKPDDL